MHYQILFSFSIRIYITPQLDAGRGVLYEAVCWDAEPSACRFTVPQPLCFFLQPDTADYIRVELFSLRTNIYEFNIYVITKRTLLFLSPTPIDQVFI